MLELELNFLVRETELVLGMMLRCVTRRGTLQPPHVEHTRMLRHRVASMRTKFQALSDRDEAVAGAYLERVGHPLQDGERYSDGDYARAAIILREKKNGDSSDGISASGLEPCNGLPDACDREPIGEG